jgi:diaminopimelate decarboxylase
MEHGRYITGPNGYLITKVLHIKESYKKYAGIDANSANLLRPAMYKAYHHITVLNKNSDEKTELYDVVGSLCENNDKLATDRLLPELKRGDVLVFHDVGAHGYSMGYNYNGKLRSAEFLFTKDGEFKMIRRAETLDDYFATLK